MKNFEFIKGKEYTIASWDTLVKIFGLKIQSNFVRSDYQVEFIPSIIIIRKFYKDTLFKNTISIQAKYRFALHPSSKQGGDGSFYFNSDHTIEALKDAQKNGTKIEITVDEDFKWVIKPSNLINGKYIVIPKELKII